MNLVDLDGLNSARFPQAPRSRAWLSARARRGELPGARKMGGTWLVDLDAFDAALNAPTPKVEIKDPRETVRRAIANVKAARQRKS